MTLSTRELADMRAHAEQLLPTTCTILYRTGKTSDGMGGWTETWGTAATSVSCRLDAMPASYRVDTSGEQWKVHNAFKLLVPYDQDINMGGTPVRVTLGGDTYHVIAVDDDQHWRMLRRAFVRRVDG